METETWYAANWVFLKYINLSDITMIVLHYVILCRHVKLLEVRTQMSTFMI